MQTPDEPEKYLRKDFYGSYSTYGTLFLDADCDIETSDNLIIYGHHIRNSAMFGALMDYKDADFWEDHQLVKFASIYEEHTYKVVAAFYAKVLNKDQEGFRYYDFIDAKDADEFNDYVAYINTNQCYDTGVDIAYGDKLLTLSTCAYDTENGRFAVVAKLIDNEAN
jgi:sortase B